MDMYGFYTGRIFDAYEFLGCHLEGNGAVFRTFAPAASRIALIGDFNGWSETEMYRVHDGNFWECRVQNAEEGMKYKFRIYKRDGSVTDHCDPYGFGMELRPQSASIIRNLYGYSFHDADWMKKRTDCKNKPLNIYEMHLGSWKNNPDNENGWYTYADIADKLISYLKENHYNYVELLPVSEHPCDNSWGYQNTGFFSPTARYGTADELKVLIDKCHQNDIGVILDFVIVHFGVDDYALANYDGTALYEYPHRDVGFSEWGSKNFIHSRGEVQSFLQSCANYWIKEFHFDGLRMDAVSNIIYWHGDERRGVNVNGLNFLKHMNQGLKQMYPSVILAAEDSTSYSNVTKPVEMGGLGFDYKWDMGWMNDTLAYFKENSYDRVRDYHKLTFSIMYFYNENYLMPFSHDEVVHGKATIIQKMNGDYEEKFPQARALYMYMYAHPGKKLNFMGNEIAQFREWDEKREQDWMLLAYPKHEMFHKFMIKLNEIYMSYPALYEKDYDREGFEWVDCANCQQCTYAFLRKAEKQQLLAVFNFRDKPVKDYELQINSGRKAKIILNSNWKCFDGNEEMEEKEYLIDEGRVKVDMEGMCAKYFIVR